MAACADLLPHYHDVVQNIRGDAVSGATVTVYSAGTTNLVTLYDSGDKSKGVKLNPVVSGSMGDFDFYVNPGIYDMVVSRPGVVSYTLEDVTISLVLSSEGVQYVPVTFYGAVADDGLDDYDAIVQAISNVPDSGGVVYFPAGTYNISTTINLMDSNITFLGEGAGVSIIDDGVGLGNNPLMEIGEEADTGLYVVSNITLKEITFTNGVPEDDWVENAEKLRSCVTARNVKNIIIDKCGFVDIQGVGGFILEDCLNVHVQSTVFENMGYSGMMSYCDNINVFVNNCIFETSSVTNFQGTAVYLLGSGHNETNDLGNDIEFIKNYWVTDNIFRNNPVWEGIDLHGGSNVHITGNTIENCQTGIMAQLAYKASSGEMYVNNPVMEDIFIQNNTINVVGNALVCNEVEFECRGIVTGGDGVNVPDFPHGAKNINVSGNMITGGGDTELGLLDDTVSYGAITLRYCDGGTITNNIIKESQACAIFVREVGSLVVSDNMISEIIEGEAGHARAFYLNAIDENHSGIVSNNLINDSDSVIDSASTGYVYVSSSDNTSNGYKVKDNKVIGVTSVYYSSHAKRLIPAEAHNVMDFATIDNTGEVPCTVAMNAAIAEIISFADQYNGVDIIIPPGHYRVDGVGIKVENTSGYNSPIFIDATGAEFVRYENCDPDLSSKQPIFTIGRAGEYYANRITLEGGYFRFASTGNFNVDGSNTYSTQWGSYGSDCLRLINLMDGYIENVECYGGYTGILMAAWHGSDDVAFGNGPIRINSDYELELTDNGSSGLWSRLAIGDEIEFHQLEMSSGHEGSSDWDSFICANAENSLTVTGVSDGVITLETEDSMNGLDDALITQAYWGERPTSGFGNAYNSIATPRIVDCRNGIRLDANTSKGWVNENSFEGGRIAFSSMMNNMPDYNDYGRAITLTPIDRCAHGMNNNRFENISIESSRAHDDNGATAIRECGSYGTADQVSGNFYINNRYEGMTNGGTVLLDFGPSIASNIRPGNKSSHYITLKGVHGVSSLHEIAEEDEMIGGFGLPFAGSHLELKGYKRFSGSTQASAAVWGDQTRTIFEVDNRSTANSPSIAARAFSGFQTGVELYGGGLIWMSPIFTDPDSDGTGMVTTVDHRFGDSVHEDGDIATYGSAGYLMYGGTHASLRYNDGSNWNNLISTRNKVDTTTNGGITDLDVTGYSLIVFNPTAGNIFLSNINDMDNDGQRLIILNTSATYTVTIDGNEADFDIGASITLGEGDTISLVCYDDTWYGVSSRAN